MKTEDRKKLGKKSRKQGQDFERKVREDLESKGWIVLRWDKNVEFNSLGNHGSTPCSPIKSKQGGSITEKGWRNDIAPSSIPRLVQAKSKFIFNPVLKRMMPVGISQGFPDFVCFRSWMNDCRSIETVEQFKAKVKEISQKYLHEELLFDNHYDFKIILIESKVSGELDKLEKEKSRWILDNLHIPIFIASKQKIKRKIEVKYEELKKT